MAQEVRTALTQDEFIERDSLYSTISKLLPEVHITKSFDVGETVYGYVVADIAHCYRSRQNRLTLSINGRWIWTTRFSIVNDQWVAQSYLPWADHPIFASPEQFASQWLAWTKSGKRQHGIRATQSFPMFNMAVAI